MKGRLIVQLELTLAILLFGMIASSGQTATITLGTGANPVAAAVNPVTNKIYVTSVGSNNVTVIDGATNSLTTLNTGTSPVAVAVNR